MTPSIQKTLELFRERFKNLNDSTSEGGYDALPYVEAFLSQALTEQHERDHKLFEWLLSDDTGVSSKTLCRHMLGIKQIDFSGAPSDKWDRGRCVRLLKIMPQWIDRLDEISNLQGWNEQIPLIKDDLLASLDEEKI